MLFPVLLRLTQVILLCQAFVTSRRNETFQTRIHYLVYPLDPVLSQCYSSYPACMWLFSCRGSFRFCSLSSRVACSVFVVSRSIMDKASLFQSIGLSEQKAQETMKNEALSRRLETIIKLVRAVCVGISFLPYVHMLSYLSG